MDDMKSISFYVFLFG